MSTLGGSTPIFANRIRSDRVSNEEAAGVLQVMKYKPAAPVTGMDVGESPPALKSVARNIHVLSTHKAFHSVWIQCIAP